MSSEQIQEHQNGEQKEFDQTHKDLPQNKEVIAQDNDYEEIKKDSDSTHKEKDNEFQVIHSQPPQEQVNNNQDIKQNDDKTQEVVIVKQEDEKQNHQLESNQSDQQANNNLHSEKKIVEVQSSNEESQSSQSSNHQIEKIEKSEISSELTFNNLSIQPSPNIQKTQNDLSSQVITSFQDQLVEQNNQEFSSAQEKDISSNIPQEQVEGQYIVQGQEADIKGQQNNNQQSDQSAQNCEQNLELSEIVIHSQNQKIENEKQTGSGVQVDFSQNQDENMQIQQQQQQQQYQQQEEVQKKQYVGGISSNNQQSVVVVLDQQNSLSHQNQEFVQSDVNFNNSIHLQRVSENDAQRTSKEQDISSSTVVIQKQSNYDSQSVIKNAIDSYSPNKDRRKFTEDTLDYNSSFQNQHLTGFVIPDDISFIKPDSDIISPESQSVMIAEGGINQQHSIKQFEAIMEVQTDHSSVDNSTRQSKMDNKNFQSAVFERDNKLNNSFSIGADRLCQTEVNELPNQATVLNQNLNDVNNFDVRRTRYRYIKCWEDKRVQIVGIFQNIINNMSTQAIQIATSSSKSNYIIIKYFKDKVSQLLQFSSMQFTQIGKKGGESFNQLNMILTELDDLNKRRMINSKRFTEFVEQSVIKEILHANSLKYESRLNRYKELTNFSIKKIQKIGRSAAEEYQDYSNIFSDLAAKDIKTKNKKKLIKDFQRKDLCLHEWIFLSKVFEHYDCLKNFGLETIKFIKELKELELQRVEGIKYEELFGKMSVNNQNQMKQEVDVRSSSKHSSFILLKSKSLKKSQDNNSMMLQSQTSREAIDSNDASPQKSRLNITNPSFGNDTKDIIEMQNLSIQDLSINSGGNGSKRKSESPERYASSRSPHASAQIDHHKMIREDLNRNIRPILAQIKDIDYNYEVYPYFMLKNYLPFEEQNYLRKIYELNDDIEVSFDHLCKFIEKFQLQELKTSQLVRKEFKAQYVKSANIKKDVLIIITFDYNLIVVESLASNFFKKPIFFIRGSRSKVNPLNNQIIVTEINNILFRTKNHYTFILDYQQDVSDFIETMKAK